MSDQNLWLEEKAAILEGLDGSRRTITETMLDIQKEHLAEAFPGSFTAISNDSIAKFDKVVMPIIRRAAPALIAMELVGVQPMNAPVGIVRALKARYGNTVATGPTADDEANAVNLYEKYTFLQNAEADYTTVDAFTLPDEFTRHLENNGGQEMNLEIVKKTIEAKSRKLQAKWTIEAQQDAASLHGIILEDELVSIVSDEIVRELDKELLGRLETLAGAVSVFDFADADGRYASEKFTALVIAISELSNQIAVATKRSGANWMVVSPNVLIALRHANNGSFVPATASPDLNPSSTLFAGVLNGSMRVYVDIHATTNKLLVGYKGASELDTGLIYSPYIPLMSSGVIVDADSFNPRMGLMTRYALTDFTNPADSLGNSGDFYRRANVANLVLGIG